MDPRPPPAVGLGAGEDDPFLLNYSLDKRNLLRLIDGWTEPDQVDFIQNLLLRMSQYQLGQINAFLTPMLQRDFMTLLSNNGLNHVAENILSYLDPKSLSAAAGVCTSWNRTVAEGALWKKLIERRVRKESVWRQLGERRGWIKLLFKGRHGQGHGSGLAQGQGQPNFRLLYKNIVQDIKTIGKNWVEGEPSIQTINCGSGNSKGVYCLQYDDKKIVCGLRDNSIKIWDRETLECSKILTGHTGSVLCLQYDQNMIISGSSDSTIRVWDINTGELLNTLIHHVEAVLHMKIYNGQMVTCSKDRSIAVWDITSPSDINLHRVLVGHRAAVNVIDFDDRYIVSASGDRSIKVWNTNTCEFLRTLNGHKRGIACLQYRENLIVSGSSDNTIRIWDIDSGACLKVLEGHHELVRCIRFYSKRIVSGAYDGNIKIWDLQAALDPRSPASSLCIRTFSKHIGRVFRLQFDELQIVSSSHDDTILIWDFLETDGDEEMEKNQVSEAEPELDIFGE